MEEEEVEEVSLDGGPDNEALVEAEGTDEEVKGTEGVEEEVEEVEAEVEVVVDGSVGE